MGTDAGKIGDGGKPLDLTARLEEWRRLLLDTSKRSRLISSKFGRGGVLAVEHPEFYQLWEQLAVTNKPAEFPWPSQWIGEYPDEENADENRNVKATLSAAQLQIIKQAIAANSGLLLTNLTDKSLDGRLKRLATAAATSLSEQGVNSLFLAFGFLRWFESADSDVPILSPLVLMPVALRKESADSSWELTPVDDDLVPNHPLTELLRADFHLSLPQFAEAELWESAEALKSFFADVQHAIADHERWEVQFTAGLGTFAFQKIAMWQDLGKNTDQITSHALCRGIAGDASRIPTTDTSDILGADADFDKSVPPESSYLVRDCDSSQLAAMELVRLGHHLILDGPPGTGKSQTITNIIARCLAANKTVLFVSEKAAALEVVKRRLDEAKLGDFSLECHSHKANKRTVVEELGRCLNRQPETYPSQDHQITELRRTRQKLNDYVRALHVKRSALNMTAYQVHGRLASIRTASATRAAFAYPHSIDRNRLQEMEEAVTRMAGFSAIIAAKAIHPWRGCRTELYCLTLPDDIRFHFDRAAVGLAKLIEAAHPLETFGFLRPSATRSDVAAAVESATTVLSYPRIPPAWVAAGLQQTAERYLALHELSKNHRILWSSIPAYTGDAYIKANPRAAAAIVAGAAKLRTWFPALSPLLRAQTAFLLSADACFQKTIDLAAKLDAALRLLRQSMGLPESFTPTLGDADGLAANAIAIAELGQAPPQWFDETERKRLRQISVEARRISSIAVPKHSQLQAKFVAVAFASGAEAQIDAVIRYQTDAGLALLGDWVRALPTLLRGQASHLAEVNTRLQAIARLAAALDTTGRSMVQAALLPDSLLSNSRNIDELAANILAVVGLAHVKPEWFDTTKRNHLHKIAAEARRLTLMALSKRSQLQSKFGTVAFAPETEAQIDAVHRLQTDADLARLGNSARALPTLMRDRALHLNEINRRLEVLASLAASLESSARLLVETTALPAALVASSRNTDELAMGILAIISLGQVRLPWFDAFERKRLRQVAIDAKQVTTMALATRSSLEPKFCATAFAPLARQQIDDVLRYRWWLRRLSKSWQNAKRSFCSLYGGTTPKTLREIFEDAFQLKRYHEYVADLNRSMEKDRESLLWDGELSFDWDLVIGRIAAVEKLLIDFQSEETARSVVTALDSSARKTILSAAQQTRVTFSQLSTAVTQAAEVISIQLAFEFADILAIPPAQLSEKSRELERFCQKHIATLTACFPFILGDQDADLADLIQLKELHECTGELEAVVAQDRESLLWDGGLSFDWNSVIGRLEAIDKLPADFQSGETAQSIVIALDSAARTTIVSAAQQIRDTFAQLSAAATPVAEVVAINAAFENANICALPPTQLVARSRELAELCQKQIASLTAVFRFIADGQNVDLADLLRLKDLHKNIGELAAAVTHDRELLQWDGSLEFDWDSLIRRLDVIELLPTDLQVCESVRAFAGSHDPMPRKVVISAAQRVRELADQLLTVVAKAAEVAKNREVFGVANCGEISPTLLVGRTTEIRKAYQEHTANLKSMFPLIANEHDVAVDGLVGDFEVLNELRSLTDKGEGITSALGETLPDPQARSLGDWKDHADLAEWVINFLKQYHDTPPGHLIRAIADDAVRAELSAALENIKRTDDPSLRDGLAFVESLFSQAEEVSTGIVMSRLPVSELINWLAMRVRDADRVSEWVGYINASEELCRVGLETLRDEMLDGRVAVGEAVSALRKWFYNLWLIVAYRGEPALREFDLAQHDQTLGRFQEVDRFCVLNGFALVRSKVLDHTSDIAGSDGQAPERSEVGILLREVNKRKRHLPLRQLFAAIPTLLPKLKPCLMMSPLAVSTYFGDSNIRFDVVIFDEASQVRPHDAICAIYRGRQLVVAGDQKQLPPTSFFERMGNDDAEKDDELEHNSSDYESILDMCATLGLPRQRLKWHYRSKRESLIAFSNWHYYGGELITFPSVRDVDGSSGVAFSYVENGRWAGGAAGGVNQAEAEQIADAVIRHAAEQPEKSLGVITMNMAQQELISDLIDARRRDSLHLEDFFSDDNSDTFFIKNLETVQGDERDVIFLGVGYAKDDAGKLSHNFGPLNRQGGERRLNVAITRARESLTIFTSIRCDDIDLGRTQSRGAKLLKAYLDFAEHGRKALAGAETENSERDFDSDFEAEVARALTERGLDVRRQIGCSGFRIDLAIVHPEHPGRFVLGVECDGATYHSSATARDRDRLRQDVLETLGWKLCRIWSTDWVRDPRRQIQKVLEAYQRNLAADGSASSEKSVVEELVPAKTGNRVARNGHQPVPQFSSIDSVPMVMLNQILIDAIKSYGAMPLDDLMQAVARKLGFQRTGARIRNRLGYVVQNLERQGQLVAKQNGDIKLYDLKRE